MPKTSKRIHQWLTMMSDIGAYSEFPYRVHTVYKTYNRYGKRNGLEITLYPERDEQVLKHTSIEEFKRENPTPSDIRFGIEQMASNEGFDLPESIVVDFVQYMTWSDDASD